MSEDPIKIPKPRMMLVSGLKPNPQNVKIHTHAQIEGIAKLIQMVGFTDPIMIDMEHTIWADEHGGYLAAKHLGMKKVPCVFLEDLTPDKIRAFMILDNKIAESDWNVQNLKLILDSLPKFKFDDYNVNFSDIIPDRLYDPDRPRIGGDPSLTQARDDVTIPDKAPRRVKLGDVWELGAHRLMCGDCTVPESKEKLWSEFKISSVCTDPPYSSGGRQEAGKKGGSIGSKRVDAITKKEVTPKIKMDDLSTRGYTHLIKSALYGLEADILYMFTDWRMWDWTREASEASGFPVRNMIVWDKETPGMGIQWRGQHELICFAKRTTLGGPFHKGNVLRYKRSGNEHHPTEKPVPLLIELIENTNGDTVYDPFAGSVSILLACEQIDKRCLCMELDPLFCDILIQRWEDYTKKEAKKL